MRILKTLFALSIALLCLFYATQNVVNLEACYAAFAYVFSHADHVVYAKSFFPAISSPALIWMTLAVVVGLEFLAGILAARGFWAMWAARNAGAAAFNAEKHYALLGCGVGVLVWFGLFAVFGGALFQMWQTEIGAGSMDDAFQFFVSCALVLLLLSREDR